jgi:hypothetical protein
VQSLLCLSTTSRTRLGYTELLLHVTVQMLVLLFRIPETLGSNLGPEIGFSDPFSSIPQSIRENSGMVPYFKPHPPSTPCRNAGYHSGVKPHIFALVSCLSYSSNLKLKTNVPPKRLLTFNGLQGVISQKKEFFILVSGTWLRRFATSQNVAESITDGVTRFSNWFNPSTFTMTLGLTSPLNRNEYQ